MFKILYHILLFCFLAPLSSAFLNIFSPFINYIGTQSYNPYGSSKPLIPYSYVNISNIKPAVPVVQAKPVTPVVQTKPTTTVVQTKPVTTTTNTTITNTKTDVKTETKTNTTT